MITVGEGVGEMGSDYSRIVKRTPDFVQMGGTSVPSVIKRDATSDDSAVATQKSHEENRSAGQLRRRERERAEKQNKGK